MSRKPILANKEDANFREALKLYDGKQYKKALKLVEQNLKKNNSHAESLALKGCIFHNTGSKPEAEAYIKKAVAKEPNNYLVDHLAGIYYRLVNRYEDAAKWFKASVDNGSPNKQILRDLSLMQAQIRDYKGLVDSRQAYLESQPAFRANWTGLAVAQYMHKDYNNAVLTLQKIEDIITAHLNETDMYEQSECVLLKNYIIAEAGNHQRALEQLEKDDAQIRDRSAFLEYKARYLLLLNREKEASVIYRRLLQRNPDNVHYYQLLETALGSASKGAAVRLQLYDKLASFYPRSDPPQFIPLTFLASSSDEFEKRARVYILGQLKRGVPSAFVNVKPLYKNKKKLAVIQKIVEEFYEKEVPSLIPTVKVWTHYFLAQHYLYLKDLTQAQHHIEAAIDHSPTLVELYIVKARVFKHKKLLEEASAIMEEGRKLDLQDRFINSKATKYFLRADKVDEAINTISLFTKLDADAVNGCKDLHLMEVNWVLVESAEAYARIAARAQTKLNTLTEADEEYADVLENVETYKGLALKRFHAVFEKFDGFFEDQADFHSYCMRKGTPRDYIDMLRWEDHIHSTPIYVRALKGLAQLYWGIYHQQQVQPEEKDQKKTKKKKKSKNVKRLAELIAKVESKKDDADPLGAKLLADLTSNANGPVLDLLSVYVKQLTVEAPRYQTTWQLAFDLYKETGKYVLAVQAAKSLDKIVAGSGKRLGPLLLEKARGDETANPAIVKVVEKSLEQFT